MQMWTFMNFQIAEKEQSPCQYIEFHTFNIRANRVAIVSSVIAKIFNPSMSWTVTIQLLLNDTLFISACTFFLPVLII